MISFAQNFEDVILARVFRDRPTGCYVDVGAHFPVIDSVTEHFYRQGWRGINVEPLDAAFAELKATRPDDLNLHCAIGAENGTARFFTFLGLSTLDEEVAEAHRANGHDIREATVETMTLAAVLGRTGLKRIDFLKVDVEGMEGVVLRSNDWQRFRPSAVLVEAIHPVTHAPSHEEWEPVLREAGYECLHFDGLNRFYWNTELAPPDARCFLPPNVLDNFTTYAQLAAEARASEALSTAEYMRQKLVRTEAQLEKVNDALHGLAGDHGERTRCDASPTGPQPAASTQEGTHELPGESAQARLIRINNAMQILARGAGTDAPHPLLASGWRTISNAQAEVARTVRESLAALSDMRARMTAAERECEEARTLLKVSEQRRLALLESRAAQEAPASDGHKPASLVLPPALSSAHVAPDARLYATREDLLRALAIPRHGIVAELGVAMGDFSARIMETLAPAQFVAFDTFEMHQTPSHWGTASSVLFDNLTHLEFYKRRFAEAGDRVRIERGDSRSTLPQYEDEFFDFIYVDAGHTYDHVKHDAVTALRKLKPGGILAFNDYIMYDLYLRVDYGVVQAVNELVVEHDLQVIGFGLQQVMFCDIAVRKRA